MGYGGTLNPIMMPTGKASGAGSSSLSSLTSTPANSRDRGHIASPRYLDIIIGLYMYGLVVITQSPGLSGHVGIIAPYPPQSTRGQKHPPATGTCPKCHCHGAPFPARYAGISSECMRHITWSHLEIFRVLRTYIHTDVLVHAYNHRCYRPSGSPISWSFQAPPPEVGVLPTGGGGCGCLDIYILTVRFCS